MSEIRPRHSPAMVLRYLANLSLGRRVLWCYLVWYVVFVVLYFDSSWSIWVSALGVSALVGVAFLVGIEASPRRWRRLDRWMAARLFLIPFCVSSFSALVKWHGFIVVFSPTPTENLLALGACGLLFAMCWAAKRILGRDPVLV